MPHIRPDCVEQSATNPPPQHRRRPNSLAARLTRDVSLLRSAGSSRRAIAGRTQPKAREQRRGASYLCSLQQRLWRGKGKVLSTPSRYRPKIYPDFIFAVQRTDKTRRVTIGPKARGVAIRDASAPALKLDIATGRGNERQRRRKI